MSRLEPEKSIPELTSVFTALGDATRLELVTRLGSGQPRSIVQLAEGLEITHQGVTKHLRVLEKAGLVMSERSGREKHYRCVPEPINDARTYLDTVAEQWGAALLRLKNFVER